MYTPLRLRTFKLNFPFASDYVFIHVYPEFFSKDGFTQLVGGVKLVNSRLSRGLKVLGIRGILKTVIPRNIIITNSSMKGHQVVRHRKNVLISNSFIAHANEIEKILNVKK